MKIKITHPSILVDPDADYAEMDIFEGESRIYRGIHHTYGKVLAKDWGVLSWYEYKVDTSKIERALITDINTFYQSWEDCYIVHTKCKRFGQNEDWTKGSFFLPTKDWDVASDTIDISDIIAYLEALASLYQFELNDASTRADVQCSLEHALSVFKAQGDIHDYAVVCDESNNVPYSVDHGELLVDVAIKPAKTADFIFIPIRVLSWDVDENRQRVPVVYDNNRDVINVDYNSFFIDEPKGTLVEPGVSVTVTDESIFITEEMIDEWNYDQAMKII